MNQAKNFLILLIGVGLGVGLFAASQYANKNLPKGIANQSIPGEQIVIREKSDIVDVVKNVGPSVVSIAIKRSARNPFENDPFGVFGERSPSQGAQPTESGIGTGFIISKEGVIVTNKHVVQDNASYVVITNDNKKYDVKKITPDPLNDLALLKIDASGLKAVQMGDSSKLEVGQTVVAMGNALGEFKNTVTVGVVSGLDREIEASDQSGRNSERLGNVIQTDAAINPGNSGGPLLNIAGQVIGINTAVASGYAQNIGFALPINSAKPALEEFLALGKISRPYLGVEYRMITKRLALINELPEGAYVFAVVQGGPAERAKLRAEDIIIEIDGKKLTEENDLASIVRNLKINQQVELKYFRENKTESTQITVGEGGE